MGTEIQTAFSLRLHDVCDEMKLPKRGRMVRLANIFDVSYQAVKKWLDGVGYPKTEQVVQIANWADVNVNWLLQGAGPKRGEKLDPVVRVISEGVEALPIDDRQQVFDFIRYKFDKADGWFAAEQLARYMTMLDKLTKPPTAEPALRALIRPATEK